MAEAVEVVVDGGLEAVGEDILLSVLSVWRGEAVEDLEGVLSQMFGGGGL